MLSYQYWRTVNWLQSHNFKLAADITVVSNWAMKSLVLLPMEVSHTTWDLKIFWAQGCEVPPSFLHVSSSCLEVMDFFSLHTVRFHHGSYLHSGTSVCDRLRPEVTGSNLSPSLTAFSFLTEEGIPFMPQFCRANRLIFFTASSL